MSDNKTIIEVRNVCKKFGRQKALDKVSMEVKKGEICGIIGHNGSGKSVLFKCICGLLYIDAGEICVNDKLLHTDIEMIENAGVIIEDPAYLGNYSGFRNLNYLYCIRNKKNYSKVIEAMQQVGLDPKSRKKVKYYSLGMKQRLSIAQAIMENPEILILDEPMNGLDKHGVEEMRKLFQKLKDSGKTIIFASHNKDDIEILCDHVYEMELGTMSKVR